MHQLRFAKSSETIHKKNRRYEITLLVFRHAGLLYNAFPDCVRATIYQVFRKGEEPSDQTAHTALRNRTCIRVTLKYKKLVG